VNKCATCHTDESNFKVYTCYNCHEHRPVKIEQKHVRRNIVNFQDCTRCHGRKGRRAQAFDEGMEFALCLAPTGRCALFSDADNADLVARPRLELSLGDGTGDCQRMGEWPATWDFFTSPPKHRPDAVDRDTLPIPRTITPLDRFEQWLPQSQSRLLSFAGTRSFLWSDR
jgi:hypothetical protein